MDSSSDNVDNQEITCSLCGQAVYPSEESMMMHLMTNHPAEFGQAILNKFMNRGTLEMFYNFGGRAGGFIKEKIHAGKKSRA